MTDAELDELKAGLSPSNERTARLGALVVLEMSCDGDERLSSLFSTLLRDKDVEFAAHVAALAYRLSLKDSLKPDLERAWASAGPIYRLSLVRAVSPETLAEIAPRCLDVPNATLKRALLERLGEIPNESARLDHALYLTHDSDVSVRAAAAIVLGELGGAGTQAALLRLLGDAEAVVRKAAATAFGKVAPPQQVLEHLGKLAHDTDLDVLGAAAAAMRDAQGKLNLEAVAPLIEKQKDYIARGEYNQAMAVAGQVFMRVLDHAECQYQMARAAAGMGDARRALRLLANSFEAGFRDAAAPLNDPLFEESRKAEMWDEVMSLCKKA